MGASYAFKETDAKINSFSDPRSNRICLTSNPFEIACPTPKHEKKTLKKVNIKQLKRGNIITFTRNWPFVF